MVNKIISIILINIVSIIFSFNLIQATENDLNEPQFKKINLSILPSSSFGAVQCWKTDSPNGKIEAHITGVMATNETLSPEWKLYKSFQANEGPIHLYTCASHKSLIEKDELKEQVNKLLECIENDPNIYYSHKSLQQALESLSKQCYNVDKPQILADSIKKANNIIFALGAGLSATSIPDLVTSLRNLGLVQIPSSDIATEESYKNFLKQLMTDLPFRTAFIESAEALHNKVYTNERKPTAAHYSLSRLVSSLREKGKNIYIYSSNVDNLENALGMKVDEATDSEGYIHSIMPDPEIIRDKYTIVISIGKSSDHDADLSKLYALFNKAKGNGAYEFYTINLRDNPIISFTNTASANGYPSPAELFIIPMKLIQNDIEQALLALEQELKEISSN